MRTVWKWILGVLLVLVLVGAFAAGAYFWWNRMGGVSYRSAPGAPFHQGGQGWQGGPMMRGDGFGPRDGGPRMRGFAFHHPFGGLFFFGGGLLRLVILGALLYGAYWLGRRNARVVIEPRQARPVEPAPPAAADTTPPPPAE